MPAFAAYRLFGFLSILCEEICMPDDSVEVTAVPDKRGVTLDVWAVLLAFLLALLVKLGVLQHIPW
jgi:hypothetical protein